MNHLPPDIIEMIYYYLPYSTLSNLNKNYYNAFHSEKLDIIHGKNCFDSYVRDMIRKDCDYILTFLTQKYYAFWNKKKTYIYKKVPYKSYYDFLYHFSFSNNHLKCSQVLRSTNNYLLEKQKNTKTKTKTCMIKNRR